MYPNIAGFPKSVRILRSSEFRKIYDHGTRHSCALFAAFVLASDVVDSVSRAGFTTPKALGSAVVRNRIRRRMREAVRLEMEQLSPGCSIIFNPRRRVLECEFSELRAEVRRLFVRCNAKPLPCRTETSSPGL